MADKPQDLGLQLINFAKSITPLPTELTFKDSNKYSKWGEDNLYPNFLLKIFNKSAMHKGICISKSDYIFGDGLVDSNGQNIGNVKVNPIDTLAEFVQKIVIDYVLFNSFAVEVVYNVLNQPKEFYHVPLHHVRPNKNKSKFFTTDDWQLNTRNLSTFDRYIVGNNQDGKSKMFYYSNYTPSVNNVFGELDYSGAIESIVTDTLINEFFQNNIQGGFSPAHIISSFKGVPSEDQMRLANRKFTDALSGVDGLKFILDYNTSDASAKGLQISSVPSDDYASKLIEVIKKTERNILSAHQGTSSLLFGIEKEGSLGNSTELENAYQLFKDGYVKNARNQIESGLNKLFTEFTGIPKLVFKDKLKLFAPVLADSTKEKIYTINELRVEAGLPKIADGDKLIGSSVPAPSNFSTDSKLVKHELSDADFEKIKDKGHAKADFEILKEYLPEDFANQKQMELQFDDDSDVANYLTKSDLADKTVSDLRAEIKKELGISITSQDVINTLNALTKANVVNTNIEDGKIKVTPIKKSPNDPERKVEVMYSYEKRPNIKGEKILATSRAFCQKLCEVEKLFSREDVQTMSETFGYDIFTYAGGYFFDSQTGETTPYCRHYFKRVQVIRKEKKK